MFCFLWKMFTFGPKVKASLLATVKPVFIINRQTLLAPLCVFDSTPHWLHQRGESGLMASSGTQHSLCVCACARAHVCTWSLSDGLPCSRSCVSLLLNEGNSLLEKTQGLTNLICKHSRHWCADTTIQGKKRELDNKHAALAPACLFNLSTNGNLSQQNTAVSFLLSQPKASSVFFPFSLLSEPER